MKLHMSQSKWLLDFGRQMDLIRVRYQQSLCDAYARLETVKTGLAVIYGYPCGLGESDELPALTTDDESMDDVVGWVRRVNAWMAGFARRCPNISFTVSLKEQSHDWEGGQAERSWTFDVGKELLPNHLSLVRVRGVAVFVRDDDESRAWSVDVLLPTDGLNSDIRPLRVSNVRDRRRVVAPEAHGQVHCFNAGPFGSWTVSVSGVTPTTGQPLEDIHIDCYVSALST